jgi:hypothetical protein
LILGGEDGDLGPLLRAIELYIEEEASSADVSCAARNAGRFYGPASTFDKTAKRALPASGPGDRSGEQIIAKHAYRGGALREISHEEPVARRHQRRKALEHLTEICTQYGIAVKVEGEKM